MIDPQPADPFSWTTESCGRVLQSAAVARTARHLFTTSDLPLRGPLASDGWARLALAIDVSPARLVRLKQVHGTDVIVVGADERTVERPSGGIDRWIPAPDHASCPDCEQDRPRADVVMTNLPGVALAVQVADCVPLLLADPITGAVAAVHAGWRGTAARVAQVAVTALQAHFGVRAADLVAAIGPSIGPCCYQVRGDVLDAFRVAGSTKGELRAWFRADEETPEAFDRGAPGAREWQASERVQPASAAPGDRGTPVPFTDRRYRLDVARANRDQLLTAGLDEANVGACRLCTSCHPSLFPSYRRDGQRTGRLAAVIRTARG